MTQAAATADISQILADNITEEFCRLQLKRAISDTSAAPQTPASTPSPYVSK